MSNRRTGDLGEEEALSYLRTLGYELVERNYRTRYGEIDLIMQDARTLVFVEVKYRRGTGYGSPLEAVTPKKQATIRAVAEVYLAERLPGVEDVRFDVVGIVAGSSVEHVVNAF